MKYFWLQSNCRNIFVTNKLHPVSSLVIDNTLKTVSVSAYMTVLMLNRLCIAWNDVSTTNGDDIFNFLLYYV